jgi:hypothetical protein
MFSSNRAGEGVPEVAKFIMLMVASAHRPSDLAFAGSAVASRSIHGRCQYARRKANRLG